MPNVAVKLFYDRFSADKFWTNNPDVVPVLYRQVNQSTTESSSRLSLRSFIGSHHFPVPSSSTEDFIMIVIDKTYISFYSWGENSLASYMHLPLESVFFLKFLLLSAPHLNHWVLTFEKEGKGLGYCCFVKQQQQKYRILR